MLTMYDKTSERTRERDNYSEKMPNSIPLPLGEYGSSLNVFIYIDTCNVLFCTVCDDANLAILPIMVWSPIEVFIWRGEYIKLTG